MRVLVTGSAGHLGEALMRTLRDGPHRALGVDVLPSPFTDLVGSIVDRGFVADALSRLGGPVTAVLHTATLHKPHVETHTRQQFVDVNVSGTLNLLEESVAANVGAFVFTSTTSAYGDVLAPSRDQPAAWIDEDVVPVPKNVYGVTKLAAEDLCALMHRLHGLPVLVLRTSRFFPEDDDLPERRDAHVDANLKLVELLHRRADLADVVDAHLLAIDRAASLGFDRFVISATSPFTEDDRLRLRTDPAAVIARHVPGFEREFARRGWTVPDDFDRIYVNRRARERLGWRPRHDFAEAIARLSNDEDFGSALARAVGAKGYHRVA